MHFMCEINMVASAAAAWTQSRVRVSCFTKHSLKPPSRLETGV